MRSRLSKACLIAAVLTLLVPRYLRSQRRRAKSRARPLWEKVVTVKRVEKPNRKASQPLPKTQKTYFLTLQWRVLKRGNGNVQTEGDPNQVFQTGDQLKLAVTTNQDGYLYVIHRMNNGDGKLGISCTGALNKGLNEVKKNQEDVLVYLTVPLSRTRRIAGGKWRLQPAVRTSSWSSAGMSSKSCPGVSP